MDNMIISQVEQWSIHSNIVNYLQYNRHPKFFDLDIKVIDQKSHKKIYNKEEERQILGRIDTTRASKIKAEEKFPISEQRYTIGKLLDGRECQI